MVISFNKNLIIHNASEITSEVIRIDLFPNENHVNLSKLEFDYKCTEFTNNTIKL